MRVDDLSVTVEGEATRDLRAVIERTFVQALLASLERALLRALDLPDGRVFIRRVDVAWTVDESDLSDPRVIDALAAELAAALAPRCDRAAPANLPFDPPAIAFATAEDHLAAAVIAPTPRPWYLPVVDATAIPTTPSQNRALAYWSAASPTATPTHRAQHTPRPPGPAPHPTPTLAPAPSSHASTTSPSSPSPAPSPASSPQQAAPSTATDRQTATEHPTTTTTTLTTPTATVPSTEAVPATATATVTVTATPTVTATVTDTDTDTDTVTTTTVPHPTVPTRAAATAYLVARVLELDLAEHLWCAGLPEPLYLHAAATLLLADAIHATDPAPHILSGLPWDSRPPAPPTAEPWAIAEVGDKLATSLTAMLAARNLPAPAAPVAATLDALTHTLTAAHPTANALATRCAAALCCAFQWRLGQPADLASLTAHLAHPGDVTLTGDTLRVRMPMSAIDIDIRRAGLDLNPGYAPWMRRTVTIEFTPDDPTTDVH